MSQSDSHLQSVQVASVTKGVTARGVAAAAGAGLGIGFSDDMTSAAKRAGLITKREHYTSQLEKIAGMHERAQASVRCALHAGCGIYIVLTASCVQCIVNVCLCYCVSWMSRKAKAATDEVMELQSKLAAAQQREEEANLVVVKTAAKIAETEAAVHQVDSELEALSIARKQCAK